MFSKQTPSNRWKEEELPQGRLLEPRARLPCTRFLAVPRASPGCQDPLGITSPSPVGPRSHLQPATGTRAACPKDILLQPLALRPHPVPADPACPSCPSPHSSPRVPPFATSLMPSAPCSAPLPALHRHSPSATRGSAQGPGDGLSPAPVPLSLPTARSKPAQRGAWLLWVMCCLLTCPQCELTSSGCKPQDS